MTRSPTWLQEDYRFRADDGTMATASYLAAENTAISLSNTSHFRLRVNIGDTNNATTGNATAWKLQYRVDAGTWTDVGAATAVAYRTSSHVADATADDTQRLSAVTGADAGWQPTWTEFDSNNTLTSQTWTDDYTEYEFSLTLNSVSVGNVLTFRVVTTGNTVPTITNTPQLTVTVVNTSVAPTVGALVVVGQTPTVGYTQSAAPSVGAVQLVGQTPSVFALDPQSAAPTAGTYQLVGQSPVVGFTHSAAPTVGELVFAGQTPTVETSGGTAQNTAALIDFATPDFPPLAGTNNQRFRVLVRKTGTADPTVSISLYEGGSLVGLLVDGQTVTSATGEIIEAYWDASALADGSGAGVQCYVAGTASGDSTVEIGAVAWESRANDGVTYVTPSAGILRFVGQSPTVVVPVEITPSVGTIRLEGQQPSVSSTEAQAVAPSVGTLLLVGQQPAVSYTDHQSVAPTVGTVRFAGQQPTISSSAAVTVAPSVGTVRFAGAQPSLTQTTNAWASPSVCTVRFVGEQPSVTTGDNRAAQPVVGTIRFAGQTPVVGYTSSIAPTVGTVRCVGATPTVSSTAAQTVDPTTGTVRFVGQQPAATWGDNRAAQPSAGTYRFVGQAPTVGYTHSVSPAAGVLRLGGEYPSVTVTANQWASPSTGTVRTVSQTPTASVTANIWTEPSVGTLRMVGQQPSLIGGIPAELIGSNKRKVRAGRGDRVIEPAPAQTIRVTGSRTVRA